MELYIGSFAPEFLWNACLHSQSGLQSRCPSPAGIGLHTAVLPEEHTDDNYLAAWSGLRPRFAKESD